MQGSGDGMGLLEALGSAVSDSVKDVRSPAVLFSGGLDSSVLASLAKKANPRTVLYSAGAEGSEDLLHARRYAKLLGMELIEVLLDEDDLRELFGEAKSVTGENSFMKIELGLILLALCIKARDDGASVLLSGSGAEELFLGYHAHSEKCGAGEDLDELRRFELAGLREKDIARSEKIAQHCGVRLALPYLDGRVVSAALEIPAGENFKGKENKAVLRAVARRLGLPEEICARPKRAMQYGSGAHSLLLSLRRSGAIPI